MNNATFSVKKLGNFVENYLFSVKDSDSKSSNSSNINEKSIGSKGNSIQYKSKSLTTSPTMLMLVYIL